MKLPKLSASALATVVTNTKEPYYLLSNIPQIQFEYDSEGKRTEKEIGYRYWFIQSHTEPFLIKFKDKLDDSLPIFKGYSIADLEAFEIDGNVYFRASAITLK